MRLRRRYPGAGVYPAARSGRLLCASGHRLVWAESRTNGLDPVELCGRRIGTGAFTPLVVSGPCQYRARCPAAVAAGKDHANRLAGARILSVRKWPWRQGRRIPLCGMLVVVVIVE